MLHDLKDLPLDYGDLEDHYGKENAEAILRLLEQFEGIPEARVRNMPQARRLENVLKAMSENLLYQTRH